MIAFHQKRFRLFYDLTFFITSLFTCLALFSPPSVLCLQDHFNRIDKIVYFQGHRHPHNAVRKTVGPLISRCDQKDFESFRKVFPHLCIVHILHLMRAYHDPVTPHFRILQHLRSALADSRHFEPGFYKDIPYIHCIFPLGKCHNNVAQIRATSCCLFLYVFACTKLDNTSLSAQCITVWRPLCSCAQFDSAARGSISLYGVRSAHALSSIPPLTAPSHCMASAICRN